MYTSITILGSQIHKVSLMDTLQAITAWIDGHQPMDSCHQVIVTGFHGIWEAFRDDGFKSVLADADLWVPDGIAPILISRIQRAGRLERIPGAELMLAFFEEADRKGYRSFFYGDTPETLHRLTDRLGKGYPGHRIAGIFSPPFRPLTKQEDEKIVDMINAARPDILWVGLGLPKQENWIFSHKKRLQVPVAIGVGAAFAFISGDVKRVPRWIGENGLEWLWRFIQEPKKLWRRDLVDGPRFLWHVFLEMARSGRLRSK